ncbi:MAG: NAD(P)/FAD-dependent oxidoreductase, partial [Actinobacteria bacterium]|nr:NAD(P)/FAD-dependent oxidoreductase [Actinomycetota bacterium]
MSTSADDTPQRFAVIGGGIGGLVAARGLAADGSEVHLFERSEHLGGRIRGV